MTENREVTIQITEVKSPKDREERALIPSKTQEEAPKIPYISLFRDATRPERILMIFGICCALAAGTGLPLFSLVFGNMTNNLGPTQSGINTGLVDTAATQASYFVYIGLGIFFTLGVSMSIYLSLCEKISCRIRKSYFNALIKQEIGWFDMLNPNELAAKVALDTQTVQKGIGEMIPTFFQSCATVIGGFVMGFARGWELSLVLLGALPFIALAGGLFAYVLTSMKHLVDKAYVHAGGLAEQSLNAIKTVKALCSEDFELQNFTLELRKGVLVIRRFGCIAGVAMGFLFFSFQSDHGLGFWFGSWLIEHQRYNEVAGRPYNLGDVMTIFICITMGSMILAQIPPPIKSFVQAKDSGANIFYVIERKPRIPINDPKKQICSRVEGNITFKDVEFSYPTRPEQQVLKGVNIEIQRNKKTAFVGESGSGKSTLVALIERFYDPNAGGVFLDGTDIRQFNLNSLRKKIGYVGQEPVMFSGTIKENLLYGKEDATEDEMLEALKKAEAYSFVMGKDKKLDTFIGLGGGQLSGGQKQRLAIARAILKNPPILLLDEATSALDRENEMAIQKTLDSIAGGRTTVVVAHRLTTIQDADRIYVMNNGEVAEYGTHHELLNMHGKYEALVKLQLTQNEEEKNKYKKDSFSSSQKDIVMKKQASFTAKKKEEIVEKKPEKLKEMQEKKLKEEIEMLKKTGELKKKSKRVFRRIFTEYILKHWYLSFVGYTFSLISGGVQPIMAILFGNMMEKLVLIAYPQYREKAREDVDFYAGMFVVLGIGAMIANAITMFFFLQMGEKVSMELKTNTYDKTLKRNMAYFDKPENNPGIISSRISFETQNINRLIGSFMGVICNGIGAFICGIIISFIYSWQIALLAMGLSPILVIGQWIQGKIHTGFAKSEEAYNEAGAIVMEAACNIRTVASFCNEEMFIKKFNEKIDGPMSESSRKGIISGFAFGLSQFLMFSFFAVIFYVGAVLQDSQGVGIKEFFVSLFAIIQAAGATGGSSNFLPDVGEAVVSAEKIFEILDSKDSENYTKPIDLTGVAIKGNIEVKNIWFKYPNADKYLFEDFSLNVPAGKKIAFVGPSGCGKSTLFQLFMCFYPVEKGDILIDGVSIYKMDVKQLRSLYGVVSQEPTLFQGTVAYNIRYNTPNLTLDNIRNAADKANALKFIESNQFDVVEEAHSPLKDPKKKKKKTKKEEEEQNKNSGTGFDRQVGSKGGQISGGQKQRIAIARAIIKNPKILLLDEATSALDTQNEAIVQESLNNLMIGKTSVVIAHRISTVKDSEEILMFGDGKVVERGKYENLVAMWGVFYKFERGFGDK